MRIAFHACLVSEPSMEVWLTSLKLQTFVKDSLVNGYDDVSLVANMEEKDIEEWAKAVGMKPGFKSKLKAGWRDLHGPTQGTCLAKPYERGFLFNTYLDTVCMMR
jgi:hypothetical protein